MPALYWNGAIALSIVASFAVAWKLTENACIRNCVRFSVPVFWLLWTLGLSQYVVGITLTGKLFLFQITLILVVSGACWLFFRGFREVEDEKKQVEEENKHLEEENKKQKEIIKQLENDLERIANERLTKEFDRIKKSRIDVLATPWQHRKKLIESLKTAKHTLVILSGWATSYGINDEFRRLIKDCLIRGVHVYIGYGYRSSRENTPPKEFEKQALETLNKLQDWVTTKRSSDNLHIFDFANHSKFLIKDDEYAIAGSFNWLSNIGSSRNQERSWIVYDKEFILAEREEVIRHCETKAQHNTESTDSTLQPGAIVESNSWSERISKIRETHPKAYMAWSEEEEEKLESLYRDGLSSVEIVNKLDRPVGGIKDRLVKLGLIEYWQQF